MTWVRLDDVFVDHPKVEALSDAAFRLHVRAMSYCARFSTDGEIPRAKALQMCGRQKFIDECLNAGLWEHGPSSYSIHDFLIYNPSKADLAKKAIAGAKGAAIRYGRADAIAGATGSAITPARDPVPTRPDPSPSPRRVPPKPPANAGGRSPAAQRGLNGSRRKRDIEAAKAETTLEERYLRRRR